jgi:hypothetical protein
MAKITPQPPLAMHGDDIASEKQLLELRSARFEHMKARVSATTLELAAFCVIGVSGALQCHPASSALTQGVRAAHYFGQHWYDLPSVCAWHLSLWLIPHRLVHLPKTPLNVAGFLLCVAVLFLQPHMEICRRVPYIGAIHGAASVMVLIRSFEFYLNADSPEFRAYGGWRRMFFISSWGWHDIRCVKYVGPGFLKPELLRLAKWTCVMLGSALFELAWGKHAAPGGARSSAYHYGVRWFVGFWCLLAWFNCMDSAVRALHFWADGHEVRPISVDPWGAVTLKEFWGRRWNLPVQELLTKGVYLPVSRLKWLPMRKLVAKLLVFIVSGLGHTYAISCGGEPWIHLGAMMCFFMVQIPLIFLEDTFNLSGHLWLFCAEVVWAPLFIEPCLEFVHL